MHKKSVPQAKEF